MLALAILLALASGCSSTTSHGLLTGPLADPASVIHRAHDYEDLGAVEARACRFVLLSLVPIGGSALGQAMKKALGDTGGDAILNASVTTSLYSFVPIYNVLAFTCTTVQGVAIRIR